MSKKNLLVTLVFVFLCQAAAMAQTRVSGKVTGADNAPVPGASVSILGTNDGVAADANGDFSITAPSDASLLINSTGFVDQIIQISGRSVINVQLARGESSSLNEVVVTGYTAQRKRDIVGSVAVVDVAALKSVPSSSAMQALQGQAAGVDVTNNGSPGAPSLIFIRGITGFANAPLVLIDGVQGNINDVPANDVESIQVLKDAGAASIYGARGSNGVIVITTKRGKSGAPSVTYDSYYNLQFPRKGSELNTLNAADYARLYASVNPATALFPGGVLPDYLYRGPNARGIANEGDPAVDPSLYRFDATNPANNYLIVKVNKDGQGGDMYDEIFSPALMMNHTLTASGGNERATYLLSAGYLDQQGTLDNTYLKRYNVRANTTFKIRDNIRIGENVNIFYKDNPQSAANGGFGPIQGAFNHLSFLPAYDIAGNYAGPFVGPANFEVGDWGNPRAELDQTDNNRNRSYNIIGNAFLEIDFLKNFTARTSFGGAINNYFNQTYTYRQYWRSGGGSDNSLSERSGFATTAQWTNSLAYKNNFGEHNLSVLVGTESVENVAREQLARGDRFLTDDYNYLVLGNAQTTFIPSSSANENALFSMFGRVDYSFQDKYIVGFTIRRDGFSAFGPEKKYGVFPAIAAGWRISQESFMSNVTWLDELKIRGSYGIMGNKEGINPTNAYSTYSQGPRYSYYDINGTGSALVQGFYPAQNGNAFTSWEENKLLNIGFDATLMKNRLDLSIEYYKKSTDGLLRPVQAPYTAGEARSPFVNIGDIQNKGVDIAITYRGRPSNDFSYSVGVNFTTYKNTIVDLPDPNYFDEGIVRFEEGHPMSSFFGYQIIGVFSDTNQVKSSPIQQDAAPGRYRYLDADGNDTINADDRVHFGDPNPKFTMGLNLSATLKNFDFSAILYTSQGNDIYNSGMEYFGSFERGVSNKSQRVLDAWSPTNTSSSIKINETGRNFSNSGVSNSDFLEDGSFIRLRSVQIGYNIPTLKMSNLGISRLRLYIQAVNLFTITNYSGLDPEVYGTGVGFRGQDAGAYVQEKAVAVGLNVGF